MEKFGWTPREVGYSLSFIGLLMVFVQGYLIRVAIPAVGVRMAGIIGLVFNFIAFSGYAMATSSWVAIAFLVPGALGALAAPSINSIASSQVGPDQQGELQGALASMMSLASIISPPMMTLTFGMFSGADAAYYFPGAPFVLAALLTLMSLVLFVRTTAGFKEPESSTV
ncbi:MAG: MFS transporter [Gammaproteobacteria bacterium]|nr:MFS transporter [Gammaproteobacteria bacterium]